MIRESIYPAARAERVQEVPEMKATSKALYRVLDPAELAFLTKAIIIVRAISMKPPQEVLLMAIYFAKLTVSQ